MWRRDFTTCRCVYFWILFSVLCYSSSFCYSANKISTGEKLKDGEEIVSSDKKFALGFFSPNGSDFRYLGIWYHDIPDQTVIWVANRNKPISGVDGVLTIDSNGNLVVLDGNGASVWSSTNSVSPTNSTALLFDNGNLLLFNDSHTKNFNRTFWESFSNPTDTYLPDMRAYVDPEAENRIFTSWKSESDPSAGNYSMGIDPRGVPQIVIWDGQKQNRRWRSGHWNGLIFTGVRGLRAVYLYGFRLTKDEDGRYYFTYTPSNNSDLTKFRLLWSGHEEQRTWDANSREWSVLQLLPGEECDQYNKCGSFGICDVNNSPICSCMTGFEPMDPVQWNRGNWSVGCVRKTELQCSNSSTTGAAAEGGEEDEFLQIDNVKLPDFLDYVGTENDRECREKCLKNCSCIAFSFVSGTNCMMWNSNKLVDTQGFAEGGNTLFLRLAGSELGGSKTETKLLVIVVVAVAVGLGMSFLSLTIWLLRRRKRKQLAEILNLSGKFQETNQTRSGEYLTDFSGPGDTSAEGQQGTGPELAYFSFSSVAAATDNFSEENKLGQGGFGHVYRGKLPCGEEIAVKRLSRYSRQGSEEFRNEVVLMAKLQHRNLVRLLGCCIDGEEKIIIYEYMANKSLDYFLFDSARKNQLDWKRRLSIIEGVARGLLYLHRDSGLQIIHLDPKHSNILLDEDMNPKIKDFGIARILEGNEDEAKTSMIAGTCGYMAPEYAMEGLFSVKSDVYSFGILLLEIVSGRKNTSFLSDEYWNIMEYAWDLWERGRSLELLDTAIADSYSQNEVKKCIHIAMLCVQDSAAHRPNMSAVMLMLESDHPNLPPPTEPTHMTRRVSLSTSTDLEMSNEHMDDALSSNDATITRFYPNWESF